MASVSSRNFTGLLSCRQSCRTDFAERVGRDIAGQNDDRNLAVKHFAQLCGDLAVRSCRAANCSPRG